MGNTVVYLATCKKKTVKAAKSLLYYLSMTSRIANTKQNLFSMRRHRVPFLFTRTKRKDVVCLQCHFSAGCSSFFLAACSTEQTGSLLVLAGRPILLFQSRQTDAEAELVNDGDVAFTPNNLLCDKITYKWEDVT